MHSFRVLLHFLPPLLLTASVHSAQPNIIFILTDDLGYGDLGFLFQNHRPDSEPSHRTPNLDRMADEGIVLNRHYAPSSVCAPSRASLLTGLHQGHANIRDNQFDKALADTHTLGSVLREAGYATAIIGKWGLQGQSGNSPETWPAFPTKGGFDHFFGYVRHMDGHNHYPFHEANERPPVELYSNEREISRELKGCYTTDLFTAEAKRWIATHHSRQAAKPFFLYLAYDTPHASLQIPAAPYPPGGGLHGGLQWLGKPGRAINTASDSIDDTIHPEYVGKNWPDAYKRHATMVRRIDDAIGDLFHLLRDLGIDENTLVVFTSDNGPHAESYGYGQYKPDFFDTFGPLDGIKRDLWEGGIRVPTLVRWPARIPASTASDSPSQFHDWLPTFAEISGLPAPAQTDGVSLLPTLTGTENQRRSTVYIEYQNNTHTPDYPEFHESRRHRKRGQMQIIYIDGFKGIRTDIQSATDDFEIYDTARDPGETRNLARLNASFRDLQQQMKNRVLQIRRPDPSAPRPYDSVPVPSSQISQKTNPGLRFRLFQTATPWTPDTATLTVPPAKSGIAATLDLPSAARQNNIVLEFNGLLRISTPGEYTFTLATDRGAILRLHDILLLDAGKTYESGSEISATLHLAAGDHPILLTYSRAQNPIPLLDLKWSGPDFPAQKIPSAHLFHTP